MSSIEQLETLRNSELYDDCKTLVMVLFGFREPSQLKWLLSRLQAEFLLTLDQCGKDYLTGEQRLTVYRCLADATWFSHEYHLAESYLKKALHSFKQLDKADKTTVDIYSKPKCND